MKTFPTLSIIGAAILVVSACSSAPKGPNYVYTRANEAAALSNMARNAMRAGDLLGAKAYYRQAYTLYTAVDDAEGRIRSIDGLDLMGERADPSIENAALALRIAIDRETAFPGARAHEESRELQAIANLIRARKALKGSDPAHIRMARQTSELAAEALAKRPDDRARSYVLAAEAAAILGDLEEELQGWKIMIGPREAAHLPAYLKTWK